MSFLRHSCIVLAPLAAYLAVQLGIGTQHHHGAPAHAESASANTANRCEALAANSTEEDDDDCLLCSVLHLARIIAPSIRLETVAAYVSPTAPTVPATRPHPLKTTIHSRAPPVAT